MSVSISLLALSNHSVTLFDLNLFSALVFLSACFTILGFGRPVGEEGVIVSRFYSCHFQARFQVARVFSLHLVVGML